MNRKQKTARWLIPLVTICLVAGAVTAQLLIGLSDPSSEPEKKPSAHTPDRPDPTVIPENGDLPSPYETPEDAEIVNVSQFSLPYRGEGTYANNKTLTVSLPNGTTLRVGVSGAPNDALYLNPVVTSDRSEYVCCVVLSDRQSVEYSTDAFRNIRQILESKPDERTFGVRYRLMDQLAPTAYRDDKDYGMRWRNYGNDGKLFAGDKLDFVLIGYPKNELLGIISLTIRANVETSVYELEGLKNSDVSETGALKPDTRAQLVKSAIEDLNRNLLTLDRIRQLKGEKSIADATSGSIVHEHGPYYSPFMSCTGHTEQSGIIDRGMIYAVHVPWPGVGYLTAYFGPNEYLLGTFNEARIRETPEEFWNLRFLGMDFPFPLSREGFITKYIDQDMFVFDYPRNFG